MQTKEKTLEVHESDAPQEGPYLLYVEDDELLRDAVVTILGQYGYRVEACPDGREALSFLRSRPHPCLILLDLMLPRLDGWTFRNAQLADPVLSSIPVVVLSALDDELQRQDQLRAAAYLRKPFHLPQLLATVARYCPTAGTPIS